jgi:hypothetical protein
LLAEEKEDDKDMEDSVAAVAGAAGAEWVEVAEDDIAAMAKIFALRRFGVTDDAVTG